MKKASDGLSHPKTPDAAWISAGLVFACLTGITIWRATKRKREGQLQILSYCAALIALAGATVHVLIDPASGGDWIPQTDNTAVIWVGMAIVAALFPYLTELTVAGVTLKVQMTLEKSSEVVLQLAQLMRVWSLEFTRIKSAAFAYSNGCKSQSDPSMSDLVATFLSLRAHEALEYVGGDDEKRRLSIWIFDDATGRLTMIASNEIKDAETKNWHPALGEGLIGQAWLDGLSWNEPDASRCPGYVTVRKPSYRGLAMVPISHNEKRIGVLCVDRTHKEYFPNEAMEIFKTFGQVIGAVVADPTIKALLEQEADGTGPSPIDELPADRVENRPAPGSPEPPA